MGRFVNSVERMMMMMVMIRIILWIKAERQMLPNEPCVER